MSSSRPNILYIMTDQQSAHMMSCTGYPYVKTPAMDSLAATGTRFELAYSANPVCLPARTSMVTGHMPSKFGINTNNDGRNGISPEIFPHCMGSIFRDAGYETAYGGKTHWPKGMTTDTIGFGETLCKDDRDVLADKCVEFLSRKHEKPFLLFASFINPHDICFVGQMHDGYVAPNKFVTDATKDNIKNRMKDFERLPENITREEFFKNICPPLPSNHAIPELEPECLLAESKGPFYPKAMRERGTDEDWRFHSWIYSQLTEAVDAQIGKVLDSLRQNGLEENTVVIFTSDHGDMNGSHHKLRKSFFYEESARVPFIVSQKGVTLAGHVDKTHLVGNCIDLIPTMCDFAGFEPPPGLPGYSVRPLALNEKPKQWRDKIFSESSMGRMVRDERYKYCIYDAGERREQLIDLKTDPGEMKNFINDPSCHPLVEKFRKDLRAWMEKVNDTHGLKTLSEISSPIAKS